jgi:hypothetical protein
MLPITCTLSPRSMRVFSRSSDKSMVPIAYGAILMPLFSSVDCTVDLSS